MTEPDSHPSAEDAQRAPRVFISYAQDNDAHKDRVRVLYLLLRRNHVDAQMDGPAAEQPQDWPKWMHDGIHEADFTLVIASPAYRRRAEGEEEDGVGRGVAWEAQRLRNLAYQNPKDWHRRILGVVLPGERDSDLPAFMSGRSTTIYPVPTLDEPGIETLLRYLLKQPYETVPPLGPVPHLPARNTALPPSDSAAAGSADPRPQEATGRAQQYITSYGGMAVGTQGSGNVIFHQAPLPTADTESSSAVSAPAEESPAQ